MASASAPQSSERTSSVTGNPSPAMSPPPADRRRPAPRSLPPWIASYDESYGPVSDAQLGLLKGPARITRAPRDDDVEAAQPGGGRLSVDGFVSYDDPDLGARRQTGSRLGHFLRHGRAPRRGRDWDHLRSAEPVIVPAYASAPRQAGLDWGGFIRSSAWGRTEAERSGIVSAEDLDRLQPTFNQKTSVALDPAAEKPARRRRKLSAAIWKRMMRSPLAPILFRLAVMITSILALGISGRLFHLEDAVRKDSAGRSQSIVAVAVDSVAIPFIAFTVYDELTGSPLGLRSAVRKISLILLDLFFIIFKSASTALAFESVVYHTMSGAHARALTKALAGVMLLGLLSWSINFAMNIFRTVVKLGGDSDFDDGYMGPYEVGERV